MKPLHTGPIGTILPPNYFSPPTSIINGAVWFAPWAIAYFSNQQFHYSRAGLGEPWIRIS